MSDMIKYLFGDKVYAIQITTTFSRSISFIVIMEMVIISVTLRGKNSWMSVESYKIFHFFRKRAFSSTGVIVISSIDLRFLFHVLFEIISTHWLCPYFLFQLHVLTIFTVVRCSQVIWYRSFLMSTNTHCHFCHANE